MNATLPSLSDPAPAAVAPSAPEDRLAQLKNDKRKMLGLIRQLQDLHGTQHAELGLQRSDIGNQKALIEGSSARRDVLQSLFSLPDRL